MRLRTANAGTHPNRFATSGLVPDLTLLLELPVADGLSRADARARGRDRMERAADEFHGRVAAAFTRFADADWQGAHRARGRPRERDRRLAPRPHHAGRPMA